MINFDEYQNSESNVKENVEQLDEEILEKKLEVEHQQDNVNENPNVEDIILEEITFLNKKFDEKIKYDEWKNTLFDNLHKELQKYRNGIVDKNLESMALDIIQIIDTYQKIVDTFTEKEVSEENYKKLLNILMDINIDLHDALYRQGIEPYETDDKIVDVKKQKIIKTINTTNPELNNIIEKKLAPGYEHNGKIIRPERISIYKYKED